MKHGFTDFTTQPKRPHIGLIGAICLATGLAFTAAATNSEASVIHATGYHKLNGPHIGTIIIDSDFTTLDCQGYSILPNMERVCGDTGAPATDCGVLIEAVSNAQVINCRIAGFGEGGEDVNKKGEGIYIREGAEDVSISFNTFSDNRHGIRFSEIGDNDDYMPSSDIRTSWVVLWKNTFENQHRNGVTIFHAYDVALVDNEMHSNGADGLDAAWSEYIKVFDSSSTNNGNAGLEFDFCRNVIVSGNSVSANGNYPTRPNNGISFDDSDGIQIKDNYVLYNKKDGVRLNNIDENKSMTFLTGQAITSVASGNNIFMNGTPFDGSDDYCDVYEDDVEEELGWKTSMNQNSFQTMCNKQGDM
ncbi:MAG: right-handed parallel beta-helix repeat-containing protein [Deltaproteobacteria bacterium]|nr:right-handed parallel beta-helix repeat-containing protein [Deltaproteobacteria bacterium]